MKAKTLLKIAPLALGLVFVAACGGGEEGDETPTPTENGRVL